MKTIEYLKEIPYLLRARNADQWSVVLGSIYELDKNNKTEAFARNKDRFALLDEMKTPFYMCFLKKYIKDQLNIMNYSHKENNLTDMQKLDLARTVRRVEKKDMYYSQVSMSASQAKARDWNM